MAALRHEVLGGYRALIRMVNKVRSHVDADLHSIFYHSRA